MRVLGIGVRGDVRLGLGLDLYILYHNLSYGLGSFTIKLPVISITRPGATGGRLGATPPYVPSLPPSREAESKKYMQPAPSYKVIASSLHYFCNSTEAK